MAASEARDRGVARGDSPLEHYVRQLLRDADRMRRSAQFRARSVVCSEVGLVCSWRWLMAALGWLYDRG